MPKKAKEKIVKTRTKSQSKAKPLRAPKKRKTGNA